MKGKYTLPPNVSRGLIALVALLLSLAVGRMLVTQHRQTEQLSILEAQVAALMADTSRLQLPARVYGGVDHPRASEQHKHRSVSSAGVSQASQTQSPTASLQVQTPRVSGSEPAVQPASVKFTEPRFFELNTIDSLTLIRIPGIAARTAQSILHLRQRLGGFYSPDQLRDHLTWDAAQYYMDEWCTCWFMADASRIQRIPVRTATVGQLMSHPYITREQALALVRYLDKHHTLRDIDELRSIGVFTDAELARLNFYLSFD